MNIIEATRKAIEENKGMIRESDRIYMNAPYYVVPTEDYWLRYVGYIQTTGKHAKNWSPCVEDILADDWIVVPLEKKIPRTLEEYFNENYSEK